MSFGVELYRKSAKFRVINALAGAVVGVYERDDSFRDTVGIHRVAVILTGNIRPQSLTRLSGGSDFPNRMICAPVSKFELISFSARRKSGKLMSQTNAKQGNPSQKFPNLPNGERVFRWVARTV